MAITDPRRLRLGFLSERTFNPDTLVGRKGIETYDEMLLDEQVKACLDLKVGAIAGTGWQLEPADETDAATALRDQVAEDIDRLPGSFDATLASLTRSGLAYGFSLTEKIWTRDTGRLRLERLTRIAPHEIDFRQDPHGPILSIHQGFLGDSPPMPPGKFLHFVAGMDFENPYGTSDLRSAYRPWWHKDHWVQWLAIFGEKLADPPIINKHPTGADSAQVKSSQATLEDLQARTVLSVPADWTPELFETTKDAKTTFLDAIDHYNLAIAKALLVPDKLGLVGGTVEGGSYSLGQTQLGAFFFILELHRKCLQALIQEQLIQAMVAFLRPGADAPRFNLMPLEQENRGELVTNWTSLLSAGMPETLRDQNYSRELLGYPELTEEDKEKLDEEAAQRAKDAGLPPGGVPPQPGAQDDEDDDDAPQQELHLRNTLPPSRTIEVPTTFWRPLRASEQRLDLGAKRSLFEDHTATLADRLGRDAYALGQDLRTKAAKLLAGDLTGERIQKLAPMGRVRGRLRQGLETALRDAHGAGVRDAGMDLGKLDLATLTLDERGITTEQARRFFRAKSFWVTGIFETDVLAEVQAILFNALRGDKPVRTVLLELDEVLNTKLPIVDAAGRLVNVPHRIETIARTNIAEAINEGRWSVFTDPDVADVVDAMEYSAILDSRVRANHAAWDGVVRPTAWWLGPPDRRPPNGFQCFLPGTEISGRVLVASRGLYAGPAVKLTTQSGRVLAVTSNHPVLTASGQMVPASQVCVGDHLLRHVANIGGHVVGTVDPENRPALVEDVFRACAIRHGTVRLRPMGDDLHGEGRRIHGEIDVVATDRALLDDIQAQFSERVGQGGLMLAAAGGVDLMSDGSLSDMLVGGSSTRSVPSGSTLALHQSAVTLDGTPLHALSIGSAAMLDTRLFESQRDDVAADAESLGDRVLGFTSEVAPDEVVNVERNVVLTHVYDLQSPSSVVVAAGLITSNCRCVMVPRIGIEPDAMTPESALPRVQVTDAGFK